MASISIPGPDQVGVGNLNGTANLSSLVLQLPTKLRASRTSGTRNRISDADPMLGLAGSATINLDHATAIAAPDALAGGGADLLRVGSTAELLPSSIAPSIIAIHPVETAQAAIRALAENVSSTISQLGIHSSGGGSAGRLDPDSGLLVLDLSDSGLSTASRPLAASSSPANNAASFS
jgi:hypothetical protein